MFTSRGKTSPYKPVCGVELGLTQGHTPTVQSWVWWTCVDKSQDKL